MSGGDGLRLLATASNQIEAELWQGMLAEHGIPVVFGASDVQSFLGLAPRPVRVLVRSGQHAEAERVLAALRVTPEDEASS